MSPGAGQFSGGREGTTASPDEKFNRRQYLQLKSNAEQTKAGGRTAGRPVGRSVEGWVQKQMEIGGKNCEKALKSIGKPQVEWAASVGPLCTARKHLSSEESQVL